jgi:hypothetical protein
VTFEFTPVAVIAPVVVAPAITTAGLVPIKLMGPVILFVPERYNTAPEPAVANVPAYVPVPLIVVATPVEVIVAPVVVPEVTTIVAAVELTPIELVTVGPLSVKAVPPFAIVIVEAIEPAPVKVNEPPVALCWSVPDDPTVTPTLTVTALPALAIVPLNEPPPAANVTVEGAPAVAVPEYGLPILKAEEPPPVKVIVLETPPVPVNAMEPLPS